MGYSYSRKEFAAQYSTVNSDSVRENIDGNRGADLSILDEAITVINTIKTNAEGALTDSVKAVSESGLRDDEQAQQEALDQKLGDIQSEIQGKLENIKEELNTKLTTTKENIGAIIRANVSTLSQGQG